ncbi:MAG: carbohydrate kinase [Boseongicola sp.]|nr:carbohydrate kinase [Boseongicola sp.]
MILCAGEALIDMLPRSTTDGENAFAPYAGGAVFNTSIALGRLGCPVGLFTGLSKDLFGDVLVETLAASNVDSSLAARSDRPTTLAFVKLVDGQASYAFYDENTAGRMLTEADLPSLDQSDVTALFFGGISLVVEPCAEAYAALCERESNSRVIMMDPNVRQGFITDEAAYRARLDRMLGCCDIVKVSDEDLAWIVGNDDLDAAVDSLLNKGVSLVCLTEGADGATARTKEFGVKVVAHKVEVVDTVGAGDTFNAGVLAGLQDAGALSKDGLRTLSPEIAKAALELGVQAAAVTVSRAGANPPTRDALS